MSDTLSKDVRRRANAGESAVPESGVAFCGASAPPPLPLPALAQDPSPGRTTPTPTPRPASGIPASGCALDASERHSHLAGDEKHSHLGSSGRAALRGPGAGETGGRAGTNETVPPPSPRPQFPRIPVSGIPSSATYRIPLRTGRGENNREHWSVRQRRVREERWVVGIVLNPKPRPSLPVQVLLTRVSPGRRRLDDDNLRGSLKAVRDEIARWLGVDDADPRVRWSYRECRGSWGVVVEFMEASDGHAQG